MINMKIVLAVSMAFAIALVYAERCTGPADCNLTFCANGSSLICERQECTCQQNAAQCLSRDDCLTGVMCPGRGENWHCVDNTCKCY